MRLNVVQERIITGMSLGQLSLGLHKHPNPDDPTTRAGPRTTQTPIPKVRTHF